MYLFGGDVSVFHHCDSSITIIMNCVNEFGYEEFIYNCAIFRVFNLKSVSKGLQLSILVYA